MKNIVIFLNAVLFIAAIIFWANIIYHGRLDDVAGLHLNLLALMTISPAASVWYAARCR